MQTFTMVALYILCVIYYLLSMLFCFIYHFLYIIIIILVSLKQSFSIILKFHARCEYPTQYTSRMGTVRVKKEEETDTRIMRE